MKAKNISKTCRILSGILRHAFVIKMAMDYVQYRTSLNSAPFRYWILVNVLYFIVPSILLYGINYVLQKRTEGEL